SDPRVAHVGVLRARRQHLRERPVGVGPEHHPLVLVVDGEAVVEEFGTLLAPVAGPIAAGAPEAVEAGEHIEGVSRGHRALLEWLIIEETAEDDRTHRSARVGVTVGSHERHLDANARSAWTRTPDPRQSAEVGRPGSRPMGL